MKKARAAAAIAFLLVISSPLFAITWWTQDTYYDSTWSTIVGVFVDDDCDGLDSQSGVTSDYRRRDRLRCETGNVGHWCEQKVNGTWVLVQCP